MSACMERADHATACRSNPALFRVRCVWSFPGLPPTIDWRFPFKLPKRGSVISKRIVLVCPEKNAKQRAQRTATHLDGYEAGQFPSVLLSYSVLLLYGVLYGGIREDTRYIRGKRPETHLDRHEGGLVGAALREERRADLGFGRTVASETEPPNLLASLV